EYQAFTASKNRDDAAERSVSTKPDATAASDKIEDKQNSASSDAGTTADKNLYAHMPGRATESFRPRTTPAERKYEKFADRLVKLLNL
ncbi:MAG: hypothetical protein ACLSUT_02865, partial [Christensenellales bacterium]